MFVEAAKRCPKASFDAMNTKHKSWPDPNLFDLMVLALAILLHG